MHASYFNLFQQKKKLLLGICLFSLFFTANAQETRLLRQPSLSATQITFTYGGDVWISDIAGKNTLRITSTAAVESNPHLSPDGQTIAFSSNRTGLIPSVIRSSGKSIVAILLAVVTNL